MSEVEIDYLENGAGPGVTELPSAVEQPADTSRVDVVEPEFPGWDLEHIESLLKGTGAGVHLLLGQNEREWLMTKADLERMGPPLTRIANRWQPALRLSPLADPLLFSYGAVLYVWRNALAMERRKKDRLAAAAAGGAHYEYGPGEDGEPEVIDDEAGGQPPATAYFPESPRAGRPI